MNKPSNLEALASEYDCLVWGCAGEDGELDWDALGEELSTLSEWTSRGADELISLVREHGSFILRNAAALAIAARIEDGRNGL